MRVYAIRGAAGLKIQCLRVRSPLPAPGASSQDGKASDCRSDHAGVRFSPRSPSFARVRKFGKAACLRGKCLAVRFRSRAPEWASSKTAKRRFQAPESRKTQLRVRISPGPPRLLTWRNGRAAHSKCVSFVGSNPTVSTKNLHCDSVIVFELQVKVVQVLLKQSLRMSI